MPHDSQVLLAADHLVLQFPYDKEQVAAIKRVPGARWDRLSRTWRVPLSSIPEAREFANRYGFWVQSEVKALTLPEKQHAALVRKDGDQLLITFPYDEVRIAAIRQLPGTHWDADKMGWTAPLGSTVEVVEWADTFRIPVAKEVRGTVEEVSTQRAGLAVLSHLTELKNPVDTSAINGTLYPFQHVGVRYALETRRTFIADSMGLGKTIQAIAAVEVGAATPTVVVCPPTLVLNWVYEIKRWLPGKRIAALSGMIKKPLTDKVKRATFSETQANADWDQLLAEADKPWASITPKTHPDEIAATLATADFIVLGYSTIGAWQPLLAPYANSLICDESQYIKNGKAKRTKATIKLAKSIPAYGMVLCLTGTPVLNRPAEFASQLKALGRLDDFGGEWAFYKRYCNAFKDRWGKLDVSGSSHREELNDRLRSMCYVRRLKEEVLGDLAPVRHQLVYVEGSPDVMAEYEKAEADIARYMAERAAAIAEELGMNPRSAAVMARIKAESAEHIVRLSALRRIAAKAKVEAVSEMVQEHVNEGSKVVIAAHHREVVAGLADEYGGYRIMGGMTPEEVEQAKARFQDLPAEEVPVIVLSIQAAKAGHTLTAAQDIILVELPWTPADADQVIARLHRIGQTGSVMATWVLCNDTIDHDIYAMLSEKRKVVDAVTEGGPEAAGSDVVGNLLVSLTKRGLGD